MLFQCFVFWRNELMFSPNRSMTFEQMYTTAALIYGRSFIIPDFVRFRRSCSSIKYVYVFMQHFFYLLYSSSCKTKYKSEAYTSKYSTRCLDGWSWWTCTKYRSAICVYALVVFYKN